MDNMLDLIVYLVAALADMAGLVIGTSSAVA